MTVTLFNPGVRCAESDGKASREFIQWLRTLVDRVEYALTFEAVNAALAVADATVDLNDEDVTGVAHLTIGAGAEATPALVVGSTANGGMYSSSNTLYWVTNGTTRARLNGGNLFIYGATGITNGNVFLYADASGKITLTNVTDSDFDIMRLGGNTSSCPAIKKNGATLEFKLADESAHTLIVCQTVASAIGSVSSANITGTGAGQLGHANGVAIVSAPGAGYALEFVSGVVINDYATAAYTGGGNVTFNYAGGGGALSAAVAYADSVGGAADKIALVAAAVPTSNQLVANTGINLVCAAAPTNPGTAAGVLRVKVTYRIHTTGL